MIGALANCFGTCLVRFIYYFDVSYEEREAKVLIEFSISMKVDVHGEGKL